MTRRDGAAADNRCRQLRHRQLRPRPHRRELRLAQADLQKGGREREDPRLRDARRLTPRDRRSSSRLGIRRINHNLETVRAPLPQHRHHAHVRRPRPHHPTAKVAYESFSAADCVLRGLGYHASPAGLDRRVRQSPGRVRAPRFARALARHRPALENREPTGAGRRAAVRSPVAGCPRGAPPGFYVHACRATRRRCWSRACTGWGITSSTSGLCGSTTSTCSPAPSMRRGWDSPGDDGAGARHQRGVPPRAQSRHAPARYDHSKSSARGPRGLRSRRGLTRVHGAPAAAHRRAAGRPPAPAAVA